MKNYKVQRAPFVVPTDDGKLIEEHFGLASIEADLSLAHMIAPPGWSEPFQSPDFDEFTYVIKGKKKFIIGNDEVILEAGQSIKIAKGTRVQYSNPFEESCEYIAICRPPFQLDLANREEL